MPWVESKDGHHEPSGPFDPPTDTFEKVWNHRLKVDGAEALAGAALVPQEGWPLSLRNFLDKPETADQLVQAMAIFFDPGYQHACMQAGNTPAELDLLSKRLLAFAAMLDAPVSDRERRIAARLGVNLDANPRREENQAPVY